MTDHTHPLDLSDRHVLVTGAGSGIGRSTALLLHQLGARLSVVDRDEAGLAALCADLNATNDNGAVTAHVADLANLDAIPDLVTQCVDANGLLHSVVHCAGIQAIMPLRTLQIESWRKIFAVNTEAGLVLAKAMSNRKVYAGDDGAIVFISSVMAQAGSVGAIAYSMSKAALEGIARSLSLELAPRRIRVNCIAPGFVRTPLFEQTEKLWDDAARKAVENLHPLGFGRPEDVANAVAFLIADTGRWITGSTLVVDGGYLAR